MAEKWMQKAFSAHPGKLHRITGTPLGEKIPEAKLAEAKRKGYGKQVALARTGKRFAGKRSSKR